MGASSLVEAGVDTERKKGRIRRGSSTLRDQGEARSAKDTPAVKKGDLVTNVFSHRGEVPPQLPSRASEFGAEEKRMSSIFKEGGGTRIIRRSAGGFGSDKGRISQEATNTRTSRSAPSSPR